MSCDQVKEKTLKLPHTKPFAILNHLKVFLIYMTYRCLEKLVYYDVNQLYE